MKMINKIIELSSEQVTNRRNIKWIVCQLDVENLNGCIFKEPYVSNNIDTAKNMLLYATFLDSFEDNANQRYYSDHGETETSDGTGYEFPNTDIVGCATNAYVTKMALNEEEGTYLICEGYVQEDKYPSLVEQLKEELNGDNPPKTSVEIVAKPNTEGIIYESGKWTRNNRIPTEFNFNGSCLVLNPSDKNAIVLELNSAKQSKKVEDDKQIENKKEIEVNNKLAESKTKKSRKSSTDKLRIKKTIELNELSYDDIRSIISDKFNDLIPDNEDDQDNNMCYCCDGYWVYKLYPTRAIMQNWNDDYIYYSVPYSIDGNGEVILGQPIRVEPDWKPLDNQNANLDDDDELPISMDMSSIKKAVKNIDMNTNIKETDNKANNEKVEETDSCNKNQEDNSKINKGGKDNMDEKDKKIEELNSKNENLTKKVGELEAKITELNSAVVEANKGLEEKVSEINTITTELNSLKEFKAKADEDLKKVEVNSYFENEIKKNGFTEVELNSLKSEYVDKLDLNGLKKAEADLCVKKFKELNSKQVKTTEVNSTSDLFVGIHSVEKSSEEDYSDLY